MKLSLLRLVEGISGQSCVCVNWAQ